MNAIRSPFATTWSPSYWPPPMRKWTRRCGCRARRIWPRCSRGSGDRTCVNLHRLPHRDMLLARLLDRPMGALHGRARVDGVEPALDVGVVVELLALVLGIAQPHIGGHVGDRIV